MTAARKQRIERLNLAVLLAGLSVLPALGAMAESIATVVQRSRAFSVGTIHIHRGDSIHFTNEDVFDHHLFTDAPNFQFSSPIQAPGSSTDVKFPVPGTFDVQCEIHPRMHLAVTVD